MKIHHRYITRKSNNQIFLCSLYNIYVREHALEIKLKRRKFRWHVFLFIENKINII